MPGLDPGIHPSRKKLDCRVEPGNDAVRNSRGRVLDRRCGLGKTVLRSGCLPVGRGGCQNGGGRNA
uniref:Uncharacterized protein n=1 Tax=Rhodopseudomonas palustris (strain DX-1) TaxID=652103 RepID=E6VJ21_RHOPX